MKLGSLLKAWREAEGFTTVQAAKVIGLPAMTYNRIERGKLCKADALATILIWMIR